MYLAAARLYLLSWYFFDSSMDDDLRSPGIMKAFAAALTFVSIISKADKTKGVMLYLPYYLFGALLSAACAILKVHNSSYGSRISNAAEARQAFSQAILLISRASIAHNDVAAKASKLLSITWHSDRNEDMRHRPPQLAVRSRQGARQAYPFIFYNSILIYIIV